MPDNRTMFYGAKGDLFGKASQLRSHETEAEKMLWTRLSKSQLKGLRFKRQHPISKYIADFYCHKAKLVVEVDGGYHDTSNQRVYDTERTTFLVGLGIEVLRFTNKDVTERLDWVVQEIEKRLPHAPPNP
jgi:very-short-patch-repair endonuclease